MTIKWANGKTKSIQEYGTTGCLHGVSVRFHRNGNVKDSITYDVGRVYGKASYYYKNGNFKCAGFLDETNSQTWRWFRFQPSRTGIWKGSSRNGRVETEEHNPSYDSINEWPIRKPKCKM